MEQIEINVTKNIEEVEINVQPNVTQVIISENIGSGIQSVQAGTNVTVDNTDPQNPIISATGGGGGVESVTGNIVDNTDPANPTVNFNATDYDLEDFNNASSDPFVRESELPEGLDQDNLPIKIDLTLADLGLTELGTDAEMNTAIKAYFTTNNLTVDQKQIPHIRIFDELPSAEPYLRLEFNDITILEDYGVTDLNDVEQWNGFLGGSEFESVEVNGNVAELRGGTTVFINVASALDPFDLIDFDVRNISGALSLLIEDNNTFSLDAIKITNCPNTTEISYNACPENITVLPASISNMPDLQILDISGNVGRGIETIESGALNGCTSLNRLTLTGFTSTSGNNLTAAQLDNMANWAENDAPSNGELYLSTEADISGSATIGFLTGKGWTIDNNI
jgi:hypothetical protein